MPEAQQKSEDVLTYVRRGVMAYKGRWRELAEKSGVSYSWITKYGGGVYDREMNFGLRTINRVATALRSEGFQ